LFFPEADGTIIENVEQIVVLRRRHRQFHHVADKKWHHGAAAALLRIQVGHVRHRHVVGELECVIPELLAVKNRGSKPLRSILLSVSIDLRRPAQKLFAVPV